MINKLQLQNIISKYYLNGLVESVKWVIKDKKLNIRFMSPTRDMLGELEFEELNLGNNELAIFNTSQLNKLISITSGTLLLDITKNNSIATKLNIADAQFNLMYALADVMLISKVAKVEEPKSYAVELKLENEQITALIKAKNALPDTSHLIISNNMDFNGDSILDFIFGDAGDYANKITYSIPASITNSISIPFDPNILKEILSANKDAENGKLSISTEGLMKLEFQSNDLKVVYYIVRKQNN
jgi:hypothetical protein